jgi:hypothetical protein
LEKPSGYTALLDASVLFPVFTSNLLLFLAERQLFRAKWTSKIHEEWIERRMERYPNGNREALESKRAVMDTQFPEALVTGYEALIDEVTLPDQDDQHVLAAARTCKADVIVTNNSANNFADFPAEILAPLGLFAQTADDFIADQIGVSAESEKMVAISVVRHKKSLTRSRLTWKQYYAELEKKLPHAFAEMNTPHFKSMIASVLASGEWDYE